MLKGKENQFEELQILYKTLTYNFSDTQAYTLDVKQDITYTYSAPTSLQGRTFSAWNKGFQLEELRSYDDPQRTCGLQLVTRLCSYILMSSKKTPVTQQLNVCKMFNVKVRFLCNNFNSFSPHVKLATFQKGTPSSRSQINQFIDSLSSQQSLVIRIP